MCPGMNLSTRRRVGRFELSKSLETRRRDFTGHKFATDNNSKTRRRMRHRASPIVCFRGHGGLVWPAKFSPGGTHFASSDINGEIRLWRLSDPTESIIIGHHANAAYSLAFSPDGKRLVSGGIDQTANIWNLGSRAEITTLKRHSNRVWGA